MRTINLATLVFLSALSAAGGAAIRHYFSSPECDRCDRCEKAEQLENEQLPPGIVIEVPDTDAPRAPTADEFDPGPKRFDDGKRVPPGAHLEPPKQPTRRYYKPRRRRGLFWRWRRRH